jgi:hypothetical protein
MKHRPTYLFLATLPELFLSFIGVDIKNLLSNVLHIHEQQFPSVTRILWTWTVLKFWRTVYQNTHQPHYVNELANSVGSALNGTSTCPYDLHCKIWSSHSPERQNFGLFGYDAVKFGICVPTFWRNLLPSSSASSCQRLVINVCSCLPN